VDSALGAVGREELGVELGLGHVESVLVQHLLDLLLTAHVRRMAVLVLQAAADADVDDGLSHQMAQRSLADNHPLDQWSGKRHLSGGSLQVDAVQLVLQGVDEDGVGGAVLFLLTGGGRGRQFTCEGAVQNRSGDRMEQHARKHTVHTIALK